jgi:hypothetical protein
LQAGGPWCFSTEVKRSVASHEGEKYHGPPATKARKSRAIARLFVAGWGPLIRIGRVTFLRLPRSVPGRSA